LKLSWPRPNDTKRFAEGYQHRILPIRTRKLEFINATDSDIEVKNEGRKVLKHSTKTRTLNIRLDSMARQLLLMPIPRDPFSKGMAEFDPYLESNREFLAIKRPSTTENHSNSSVGYKAVSALISSTCENMGNDLYGLLVRMSLGDENLPALATRHAIAAISYQHIGQEEAALTHKTNSINALQRTVDQLTSGSMDTGEAFRAMAASMLLSIFEVCFSSFSLLNY